MHEPPIPHTELDHFSQFREDLFSRDAVFQTPQGKSVPIIYTDSTAMGPPLRSIETRIQTLVEGCSVDDLREEYERSMEFLRGYLNAGDEFELIGIGTGCTGGMNLLTRDIFGYRLPDRFDASRVIQFIPKTELPVFITTLMEHHSSDLVLRECLHKKLMHIGFDDAGLPDMEMLERVLSASRAKGPSPILISWSAGSNVTGIQPNQALVVDIGHRYGAHVVLDYAAAGPYVELDLLELNADAVGLSPHKFPGGPQSSGLLCVRQSLLESSGYRLPPPRMSSLIEMIRIAEVFRIKKAMCIEAIRTVVGFYAEYALNRLAAMPGIEIIGHTGASRFAIISFLLRSHFDSNNPPPAQLKQYLLAFPTADGSTVYYVHHNLVAKLLNDIFGIQVRPGCSCAGPYGHWLLGIDDELSRYHRNRIDRGLLDLKPGWIRVTFNELNSFDDVKYVLSAIEELSGAWQTHTHGYSQDISTGAFSNQAAPPLEIGVHDWTSLYDPNEALSNPAVERFVRERLLPYAANTHTEVSFTGTATTHWYHWAQETIRQCCGADEHYVLRFIRAGYEPLRCLLFALGLEIPARLEARYHLSQTVPPEEWHRVVTLGTPLNGSPIPLLADVVPCRSIQEVLAKVGRDPAKTFVLLGFDPCMPLKDVKTGVRELADMNVPVIAEITDFIPNRGMDLSKDKLAGAVVTAERLPGGLQTHPVLLLQESLFGNRLPMDVGGGIVDWTTEHLQRYVSDRTVLEDAGTPGIIQGIRTALVIGLVQANRAQAGSARSTPPVC